MPPLPNLADGGGLTIDLWITLFDLTAGGAALDSRDRSGRGIAITTTAEGSLALELCDGRQRAIRECPSGLLHPGVLHHVVFAVDGARKATSVVIDGRPCDAEGGRQFAWTRLEKASTGATPGGVSGGTLRMPMSLRGRLKSLRIYNRCLNTSEASGNCLAECNAPPRREMPPPPQAIAPVKAPFPMPQLERPRFPNRTFDIRDYGAVPDGRTLNSKPIAAAIAACAEGGGGRVLVPEGLWLTGAIHLKSNVDLHLAKGAVLRFSTDPKDYLPVVFTRWAGFECYNYSPLIYAHQCTNIAVTGEGWLDGQGEAWWNWTDRQPAMAELLMEMGRTGLDVEKRIFGDPARPLRPQFLSPIGCKNVLIEGISLNAGPFWTIQCIYCENVIVRGVTIDNYGPNNDGVNLDSCKNALVEYCEFQTGDDCVALKSGVNEDGWRVGRPTENVVIRNCLTKRGGGCVTIGSETSGGIRHVYAHDCRGRGTNRGFRLKSARGRGGMVEDVWVQNMEWEDLQSSAISMNAFYTAWAVTATGKPPAFRNIHIQGVNCKGATAAVEITGLEEQPIENVTLENLSISAETGIRASDAVGLKILNCSIRPRTGPAVILTNTRDALLEGMVGSKDAGVLLELEGNRTRAIRFMPVQPSDAKLVRLGAGVEPREFMVAD